MTAIKAQVFVIDDDESIRSALARSLGKRGFDVVTFASAQAFLDVHDISFFGCIVLDQGMPEMTGLELQQVLLSRGAGLPIIFITGHGGVPESVQAIKAGAIDFLEKPFRAAVLEERINTAFQSLEVTFEERRRSEEARRKLTSLTSREREIVNYMIANPSQTTSKDIARFFHISPRTVDHHRARILEKLQINSIVELASLSQAAKLDT